MFKAVGGAPRRSMHKNGACGFNNFARNSLISLASTVAAVLAAGMTPAHALSTSCSTLNGVSGSTSYSGNFAASSFVSGEAVTFSYTDDGGDPATLPPFATDHIRIQDAAQTNAYNYNYDSSSQVSGLHSVTVTSSQLMSTGLDLIIIAGTHIGPVSISCAGAVSAPTVSDSSASVVYRSSNTAIPLSISGTADSVAIITSPTHGTASVSGTSVTYTPTTGYAGSDSFTYKASNSGVASSIATVSITVALPTITFSPSAGALAGGSVGSSYNQTISASGASTTVSYTASPGSLPTGLSLNGSTGVLSGTPTTVGNSSFAVTVADAYVTLGTANYTLSVAAALPGAPTIGSATAGDGQATVSFSPPLSNGGAAIDTYTVRASSGATSSGISSPITITGLANGTSYTFTVTAHNSVGSGSASSASNSVTPTASLKPPVANPVTATVAANSSNNPIGPVVTGGTAASISIVSNPAHGTATASGTSLTYTPAAGYSGADSFTYKAGNTAGTSTAATVSITVSAPNFVFSPAVGAFPAATAGYGYNQTVSATGGSAPYRYVVGSGSLPAGLSLDPSSGVISGTPSAGGDSGFTITATDANGVSGSASYTLSVTATDQTIAVSPSTGALSPAIVGTAYAQTIGASGGTAPYSYAVSAGSLPAGLSLEAGSGAISGTPSASGNGNFTVTVTDASGASATASYTLAVKAAAATAITFTPAGGALTQAMAGEAYSQQVAAKGGSGALIYSLASGSLPNGMVLNISIGELTGPLKADTQGDYAFAIQAKDGSGVTATANFSLKVVARQVAVADQVVQVAAGATPNNVYLNKNATGGPFTKADVVAVEPPEAGTAEIVKGELAAASATAAPVGWYLKFTPNSSYKGQARISFRLTSSLGMSNTGTVTYNLDYKADEVAADIDSLVHGFVQARQNMIVSTIKVPGLLERRQMANATEPVTTTVSPSEEGMTLGFSTSLAQLEAARDHADGASGAALSPFNIWIDGAFLAHNRDENGGKWGSFAMLNMGADYLLSRKALIGLSLHYDRMTDPTDEDAELTGNGWLAGPYASLEIGKGVFWDTSLLYGGSSNDIDTSLWDGSFETTRWMADTSIKGQWNLDERTVFTPRLRAVYFSETVDDYAVRNGNGDTVEINGFTDEQLRISFGAEIARQFTLENGTKMTPKLGLTGGFSGLDGSGAFGSVNAGLSFATAENWAIEAGLLFNIEGDGQKSVGAKVGVSKRF